MDNIKLQGNISYTKTHHRQVKRSKKQDKRTPRDLILSLSTTAKSIYNVLLYQALRQGSCRLSQWTIGSRIGRCRYTVNKIIKYLESLGLITIKRRWWCPHEITIHFTLEQLAYMAPYFSAIREYLNKLRLAKLTLYTKDKEYIYKLLCNCGLSGNSLEPLRCLYDIDDPPWGGNYPKKGRNEALSFDDNLFSPVIENHTITPTCKTFSPKTDGEFPHQSSLIENYTCLQLATMYTMAPWLQKMGII